MPENESIDHKKAWLDLCKENLHIFIESAHQESIAHFKAILDYSKIAINGAFLLNGMAGVAILYNIKSIGLKGYRPLFFCSVGAVLAILCAGVSYIAQKSYAKTAMDNNKLIEIFLFNFVSGIIIKDESKRSLPELMEYTAGNRWSYLACGVWILSVVFFIIASYLAFSTLQNPL